MSKGNNKNLKTFLIAVIMIRNNIWKSHSKMYLFLEENPSILNLYGKYICDLIMFKCLVEYTSK